MKNLAITKKAVAQRTCVLAIEGLTETELKMRVNEKEYNSSRPSSLIILDYHDANRIADIAAGIQRQLVAVVKRFWRMGGEDTQVSVRFSMMIVTTPRLPMSVFGIGMRKGGVGCWSNGLRSPIWLFANNDVMSFSMEIQTSSELHLCSAGLP